MRTVEEITGFIKFRRGRIVKRRSMLAFDV
jgi:hypothetical protein